MSIIESSDTAGEILLDAAEIIEDKGWIQNAWQNEHGVCLEQAVLNAIGNRVGVKSENWRQSAVNKADLFIRCMQRLGFNHDAAGKKLYLGRQYNDTKGRTKQHVLKRLRKAAGR